MTAADTIPSRSASLLETAPLPVQIHRALEEAIIAGRVEPGSRMLPDEIAERYGVSRIPVREALSSLAESGWVEIRPRYGVYVRARTRAELAELFEARQGIESEVARLAARRATGDHLAQLTATVTRSEAATAGGDADELSDAAVEFNALLRQAAGNAVLTQLSLTLEKRARFYFSPIAELLGQDWIVGQRRLVGLLTKRDVDAAGESARRHIAETGDSVARLLAPGSFSD